jgi:hypothetical protein
LVSPELSRASCQEHRTSRAPVPSKLRPSISHVGERWSVWDSPDSKRREIPIALHCTVGFSHLFSMFDYVVGVERLSPTCRWARWAMKSRPVGTVHVPSSLCWSPSVGSAGYQSQVHKGLRGWTRVIPIALHGIAV